MIKVNFLYGIFIEPEKMFPKNEVTSTELVPKTTNLCRIVELTVTEGQKMNIYDI